MLKKSLWLVKKNWGGAILIVFSISIFQVLFYALGASEVVGNKELLWSWLKQNYGKVGILFGAWFLIDTYISMGYLGILFETMFPGKSPGKTFLGNANKMWRKAILGQAIILGVMGGGAALGILAAILSPVLPKIIVKLVAPIIILFTIGWFVGMFWFGVKIVLWQPLMFKNNSNSWDAIKCSYTATKNLFWKTFLICSLPVGIASALAKANAFLAIQVTGELLKFFLLPVIMPAVILIYCSVMVFEKTKQPTVLMPDASPASNSPEQIAP